MDGLRRSSRKRKTKKVDYGDTFTSSYPDNLPQTMFERHIAQLNNQSFFFSSFAAVDDAIVYSLFSSKRRTNRYRTMIPACAFREEELPITKEQGLTIRRIYTDCVGEQGKGQVESIRAACNSILIILFDVFTGDKLPILCQ